MKMLIALAALLALVAAQCSPEGNTYADENGRSVTFGAAVGDWVPGLIAYEDEVVFVAWTQATTTRWTVQEFESTADSYCDVKGQYNLEFYDDCNELHFTPIYDSCGDRAALFKAATFMATSGEADCASTGSMLGGHFPESEEFLRFSGDAVTVVFGADRYALVSIGASAVIVQRWRLTTGDEDMVEVVDLASYPSGFSCNPTVVGTYMTSWDEECSGRFCGDADDCKLRAELFHNTAVNDFEGDMCSNDVDGADDPEASCSDGRQWLKHPYDCIDQDVPGGCMYCKGIAMGETTMWCMNREGADCETIWESAPGRAYCNLEFECKEPYASASTASLSIALLICSLLAFLLH